jgi:hypothetical protein
MKTIYKEVIVIISFLPYSYFSPHQFFSTSTFLSLILVASRKISDTHTSGSLQLARDGNPKKKKRKKRKDGPSSCDFFIVLKQESLKICKPRFVLMNRVTWVILKLIV